MSVGAGDGGGYDGGGDVHDRVGDGLNGNGVPSLSYFVVLMMVMASMVMVRSLRWE